MSCCKLLAAFPIIWNIFKTQKITYHRFAIQISLHNTVYLVHSHREAKKSKTLGLSIYINSVQLFMEVKETLQ